MSGGIDLGPPFDRLRTKLRARLLPFMSGIALCYSRRSIDVHRRPYALDAARATVRAKAHPRWVGFVVPRLRLELRTL